MSEEKESVSVRDSKWLFNYYRGIAKQLGRSLNWVLKMKLREGLAMEDADDE